MLNIVLVLVRPGGPKFATYIGIVIGQVLSPPSFSRKKRVFTVDVLCVFIFEEILFFFSDNSSGFEIRVCYYV